MSLILEALRKSEAERRRGAAPGVTMELPPTPTAHARTMPPWLLPLLVTGVLAALAAFWWPRRDAATPPPTLPRHVENAARAATAAPVVVARTPPAVAAPAVAPPAAPSPTARRPDAPPPPSMTGPALPPPAPVTTPAEAIPDIAATALPPVKLSMHMWDADPARRFVILDGQRLAEGDRSGGLTVVAIDHRGVVIERDGQRARVPLP